MRIVEVAFIGDVVKVGQVLGKCAFGLTLLEDVLSLVPVPSLVNLTEVLNDQVVALDSILSFAEYAETLRMNSEVIFIFAVEVRNSTQDYRRQLFLLLVEHALNIFHDVV